MGFNLIDGRYDFHVAGNIDKMVGIEIAHADGAEFSLFVRLFQCAVCAVAVAERLVQKHQVDIVGLQLAQALVDGCPGFFVAVIRNPYFRYEEDLLPADAAFADGIADTFFVVIGLCRVNHAVSDFQCIRYTTLAFGRRHLIDAVAYLRHFDAIVQFYCLHTLCFNLFDHTNIT